MKRASGEFFQAVDGLRRAVEAEFTGNGYYLLSQQINELNELLGWDNGVATSYNGGNARFALSLNDVRKRVEAEFFDNRFYLVTHKLDVMAFLGGQFSGDGQKLNGAAQAKIESHRAGHDRLNGLRQADASLSLLSGTPSAPTFDDLAAASMARVEQVAAALGVHMSPGRGQSAASQPETLADGELERRSSEPCFLGEFFPQSMDEVASPSLPAETVPAANIVSPPPDLGLSSSQIHDNGTASDRDVAPTEEERTSRKVQSATPTHDRSATSTGETMTKTDETKPAEEKSLFTLWLDLMFGRKS